MFCTKKSTTALDGHAAAVASLCLTFQQRQLFLECIWPPAYARLFVLCWDTYLCTTCAWISYVVSVSLL
ncbi:hypothetical protein L596_028776 [Steinernema carpocapsae]|uniref:Uncharacterized protein n=1 Tax=Steinernema carpocapsae TaxID=34508 RepID=A0A4U5LZB4_STECR|nr:hypothetical protein L596_028776 [Steinernema carpocapsae]